MIINATGPGRKGGLEDGVGRLLITQPTTPETKQLKVLFDELRGNLGFWTTIMWAAQNDRLTKADQRCFARIVDRVHADGGDDD